MNIQTRNQLNLAVLRQKGVINELAKVFATETARAKLLSLLDLPAISGFTIFTDSTNATQQWWDTFVGELEQFPGAIEVLIRQAISLVPSSTIFTSLLLDNGQPMPQSGKNSLVSEFSIPSIAPNMEQKVLASMAMVAAKYGAKVVAKTTTLPWGANPIPPTASEIFDQPNSAMKTSFAEHGITWLHISDLHFGEPGKKNQYAKKNILAKLLLDAKSLAKKIGPPDFIFVTGDIAYRADLDIEYKDASVWLKKLASEVGTPESQVFFVPGNHDVNRYLATNGFTPRVIHQELRKEPACFDEVVDDLKTMEIIWAKFQAFSIFANQWKTSGITPAEPFWILPLNQYDRPIILVGMNTAINSFDDQDNQSNLAIGQRQIYEAISNNERNALLIVLMHHPPEWLRDGKEFVREIVQFPHIILSGHVHQEEASITKRLNGQTFIRLDAGSAHVKDSQTSFGYAWGRLALQGLTYYPRTWMKDNVAFTGDRNKYPDMGEDGAIKVKSNDIPELLAIWIKGNQS